MNWRCDCGHEVISETKPAPLHWDDGHICWFRRSTDEADNPHNAWASVKAYHTDPAEACAQQEEQFDICPECESADVTWCLTDRGEIRICANCGHDEFVEAPAKCHEESVDPARSVTKVSVKFRGEGNETLIQEQFELLDQAYELVQQASDLVTEAVRGTSIERNVNAYMLESFRAILGGGSNPYDQSIPKVKEMLEDE